MLVLVDRVAWMRIIDFSLLSTTNRYDLSVVKFIARQRLSTNTAFLNGAMNVFLDFYLAACLPRSFLRVQQERRNTSYGIRRHGSAGVGTYYNYCGMRRYTLVGQLRKLGSSFP